MEKLIDKGNQLAKREIERIRPVAKLVLSEAVPVQISVIDDGDDLIIEGAKLSDEICMNTDLRDIAFLMREAR